MNEAFLSTTGSRTYPAAHPTSDASDSSIAGRHQFAVHRLQIDFLIQVGELPEIVTVMLRCAATRETASGP